MIRSKGEAGTGDVSEAMRHLRTINSEIRAGSQERRRLRRSQGDRCPYHLVKQAASLPPARRPSSPAVSRPPPMRR